MAQDYILLQRLARCLPPDVAKRCFLVPAQRVVLIFVTGDVLTFLLQAGGGGMEAMKDAKTVNLGQKVGYLSLPKPASDLTDWLSLSYDIDRIGGAGPPACILWILYHSSDCFWP